jgi:hypothetical protein
MAGIAAFADIAVVTTPEDELEGALCLRLLQNAQDQVSYAFGSEIRVLAEALASRPNESTHSAMGTERANALLATAENSTEVIMRLETCMRNLRRAVMSYQGNTHGWISGTYMDQWAPRDHGELNELVERLTDEGYIAGGAANWRVMLGGFGQRSGDDGVPRGRLYSLR